METVTNNELQLAFDFVQYTNRNIFLTGKAGTGKTTFLHTLKKISPKRMIVVAPTGVAAINAGGVTIHSFFQLPFSPFVPAVYLTGNQQLDAERQKRLPDYKMSREKINIIRSLDLLVIDEISMVRSDTLDAVDAALRRYRDRYLPFGGVQLLMIGDLQQLAPVVKDDDREILSGYYDTPFFFGSRALRETDYVTIELNHIFRQSDRLFIDILNKVRDNDIDAMVLDELNKRHIPGFDPDSEGGYITLTTHNHQAQTINDSRLERLPGTIHSFMADVTGEFPEYSYPAPAGLVLRKGAQVMFVRNDSSHERRFFNGKIGKVTGFEDDTIIVKCPDDDAPISVERAEWQNMKFTLDEETKEIIETPIGSFTQYPLRLAWAITIHKSQGLTFERAIIDAHSAFAHGQVYVALSRCRTLDGLVLSSRIERRSIIDDPVITGFITDTSQNPPGREMLDESRRAYQTMLLRELFSFDTMARNLYYCMKLLREHRDNIMGDPVTLFEKASTVLTTDIIEVAARFNNQLTGLMNSEADAENNSPLQERVMKAGDYFSAKLEEAMREIIGDYSVETDNKAIRKSVNEAIERLRREVSVKTECLEQVKSGFTVSSYLETKAKASVEMPAAKKRSSKNEKVESETTEHHALLSSLKEWRNSKAGALGLPHYMILPQKTMVTLAAVMPQTSSALGKVKGMGKKKTEQYGDELLEIIATYCNDENIEAPEETTPVAKKPKKVREDTKKISFGLYREGKSIDEIATERGLSIHTIESHLAHFVQEGEIAVQEFVAEEKVALIMKQFDGSEDLTMAPVKEALGETVSWGELRFVVSHIRSLSKKK